MHRFRPIIQKSIQNFELAMSAFWACEIDTGLYCSSLGKAECLVSFGKVSTFHYRL